MKKSFLLLCVVCLIGCSADNPEQQEKIAEVVSPLQQSEEPGDLIRKSSPKPDTLRLAPSDKFALDTEQPVFSFPVSGASSHQLLAHLADGDGRRSISYLRDGAKEELASAQFHLPPVGAINRMGESLACYNRLVGQPSERTEGAMPDPTQGVHLYCRFYDGEGWGRELRLGAVEKAAWAQSVTALADGAFRVVYLADEGWLVDLDPRHRVMSVRVAEGSAEEPALVRPYTTIQP
jgi:hypothetical protein